MACDDASSLKLNYMDFQLPISTNPVCGNGMREGDEQCDDGNQTSNDGCSEACINELTQITAVCGDGKKDETEACDDANNTSGDGCSALCSIESTAGSMGGSIAGSMGGSTAGSMGGSTAGSMGGSTAGSMGGTDAGSMAGTDAGSMGGNQVNRCGDGFRSISEDCDDGNNIDWDGCQANCTITPANRCGDGRVADGEACDDGNLVNGDGCSNQCVVEVMIRCGDGIANGNEQCDDGNLVSGDGCSMLCEREIVARCGDGMVNGNEQCDDGNQVNTDACLNTCQNARCGDNVVQAGVEQCDDNNQTNTDACLNTCQSARCGDGIVQAGVEQCDDGNQVATDSCTNTCTTNNMPPACVNDAFEVNNTFATAVALPTNSDQNGQICSGDIDWFKFDLCAGGSLTVDVTFTHSNGDIDISLRNSADSLTLDSSVSVTDSEQVTYTNAQMLTQSVYLKVYVIGARENSYQIRANISNCTPPPPVYREDLYEENDTFETAVKLNAVDAEELGLASSDDDWFKFFLCPNGTLNAQITFQDSINDIDMILVDSAQGFLADSTGITDIEQISYVNPNREFKWVYLNIYGISAVDNAYQLTLSQSGCVDDRVEENDTLQTAELLASNLYSNLDLISGNEDWFAIDVCRNCPLDVKIEFNADDGDLDMFLYDENMLEIDSSNSVTNLEEINFRDRMNARRMYVKVIGFSDDQNRYDLTIRVDDRLEENDTTAQAALWAIPENTYGSLVVLANDDDWYMVNVCAGGTLDVRVDFVHANGDLDMKLYAEGNYTNTIDTSITVNDYEQVSYTSVRGGNYFVHLYGYQGDHNDYDMVVNVLNCP